MLCDCGHIGIMHGIDGFRPFFDRPLSSVGVRIKRIEKLPKRRVELLFAGLDATDHLSQRIWLSAEQVHGRLDEGVA
jgi:hypothetical protein